MTSARARRSALYMPASNVRAIGKARELDCDVLILDLEDAVAPESKDLARQQAVAEALAGGFGGRELVIRVNGLDTPWGEADMAAAREASVDAILVPKVSTAADLHRYRAACGADRPLWAMIETCAAFMNLPEISATSPKAGVEAWVLGTNDLAKEMRCALTEDRAALQPLLTMAVAAGRAAELAVLDGVYNAIEDDAGLQRQCEKGLELGFDGKTLIHPRQVAIANRAFSPSGDDVAWARQVVEAFAAPDNADKGVLRLDGKMVERLHLKMAEQVLALADAPGA